MLLGILLLVVIVGAVCCLAWRHSNTRYLRCVRRLPVIGDLPCPVCGHPDRNCRGKLDSQCLSDGSL
jgi:hypothetical protein